MRCCFPPPHSFEHFDQPLITHSCFEVLGSVVPVLATVKVIDALNSAWRSLEDPMTTIGPSNGPLAISTSSLESSFDDWPLLFEDPPPRKDSLLDRMNLKRVPFATTLVRSVFITSFPLNIT